ncbi:MAG: hypothetical protein IPH35_23495 [Rhodoferax sp.]|nr:hypothetical protein [Rhodoferax sp.]
MEVELQQPEGGLRRDGVFALHIHLDGMAIVDHRGATGAVIKLQGLSRAWRLELSSMLIGAGACQWHTG